MNVTNFFISSPTQIAPAVSLKLLADKESFDTGTVDTTDYSYLRIIATWTSSDGAHPYVRFNGDSANKYHWRCSTNGAADTTDAGATSIINCSENDTTAGGIITLDMTNYASAAHMVSGMTTRNESEHTRFCGYYSDTDKINKAVITLTNAANKRIILLGI